MAGVFTAIACGSSDAHLNPAVTLGFRGAGWGFWEGGAVYRSTNAWRCCWRGAGVVALFAALEGDARCCGEVGVFLYGACDSQLDSEFDQRNCGTFVLVFVVGAIFSKSVAATGPGSLGPYLVGSLVWGIGLSLGGTTGYAINPARDLGPRVAHAILPVAEKGGSMGYAPIPGQRARAVNSALYPQSDASARRQKSHAPPAAQISRRIDRISRRASKR